MSREQELEELLAEYEVRRNQLGVHHPQTQYIEQRFRRLLKSYQQEEEDARRAGQLNRDRTQREITFPAAADDQRRDAPTLLGSE